VPDLLEREVAALFVEDAVLEFDSIPAGPLDGIVRLLVLYR